MNVGDLFRDFDNLMIKHGFTPMGGNVSLKTELELVDIYGRENVRVNEKGRLQVQEEHFHQPGGRMLEWVEADDALPPADPSDMSCIPEAGEVVTLEDPVPDMTAEDYQETLDDADEVEADSNARE